MRNRRMQNTVTVLLVAALLTVCMSLPPVVRSTAVGVRPTPVVVVDAGHGGIDGGAVGIDGTVEKDVNLAVADHLCQLLTAWGFRVVMTRRTDTLIGDNGAPTIRQRKVSDIHRRLAIVEESGGILVSIHQNHYDVEKYNGAQAFYAPNGPESRRLAELIQQSLVNRLQPDNKRAVKPSDSSIYLLYHTTRPAVMVECGFLSNRAELARLKQPEYQQQLSFAIACAVAGYWQNDPAEGTGPDVS